MNPPHERFAGLPRVVLGPGDDDLAEMLHEAQLLLLRYPAAAQAAFKALVAEGRRFAETPQGRRWRSRLAGSELVRRGRILWEGSALDMLEESGNTVLPSSLLDAVLSALTGGNLDAILAQISLTDPTDANLDPA